MSMITGTIKSLLSIKVKPRHDTLTDQFSRIFMVKMTMVCSMLLGLNWLKDEITCIIPSTTGMDGGGKAFVHEACWIQGFYVYKDLPDEPGKRKYFGIPRRLVENGVDGSGNMCVVHKMNEQCQPLKKTFYLQYQWFPFFMAALGLLFYLPYVVFRVVNTDIISLKESLTGSNIDVDEIVTNYFNYQINSPTRMRMRIIGNICIKLCYVISSIIVFIATDIVINGDFLNYGSNFIQWNRHGNENSHDYTSTNTMKKAGDKLLPTFGICEVLELSKDIKHSLYNQHRFVCEISQNVLYQYVLMIMWFLFIFSIISSCIGLILQLVSHLIFYCFLEQGSQARKVYQLVTVRECEYLEIIRRKDLTLYGKILRKLKEGRIDKYMNKDKGFAEEKVGTHDPCEKCISQGLICTQSYHKPNYIS